MIRFKKIKLIVIIERKVFVAAQPDTVLDDAISFTGFVPFFFI